MSEEHENRQEQGAETPVAQTRPGELESLRAELEAIKLGARPECAKDVVTLAGASGSLEAGAIGGVLAKYPQFKAAAPIGAPNPPGAGEAPDPFLAGFLRR